MLAFEKLLPPFGLIGEARERAGKKQPEGKGKERRGREIIQVKLFKE
jgi:hypothetical protein